MIKEIPIVNKNDPTYLYVKNKNHKKREMKY